MKFKELSIFQKEFRKLKKKYKSLDQDLDILKKVIDVNPTGNGSKHWNILHNSEKIIICKIRMQCRYLKRNSFRVIYAYHKKTENAEFVQFLEIYFKGVKTNEDRKRIEEYLMLFSNNR